MSASRWRAWTTRRGSPRSCTCGPAARLPGSRSTTNCRGTRARHELETPALPAPSRHMSIALPKRPALWRDWLLADEPASRLQARLGRGYLSWLTFSRNPLAVTGLGIVLGLVLVAALAPWFATQSPIAQALAERLQPPSAAHWLGTDEFGRDIYSRIVYGSRITLYIVGLVVILVGPVGLLIGTVAGYLGGWIDTVLMRITD